MSVLGEKVVPDIVSMDLDEYNSKRLLRRSVEFQSFIDSHKQYAGYHAHEWDRFIIQAGSFRKAAEVAAALGWWLHCWRWEETFEPGYLGIVDVFPVSCNCLDDI